MLSVKQKRMINDHLLFNLDKYNSGTITSIQLAARLSNLLGNLAKWELEIREMVTSNKDLMIALNGIIPSFSRNVRKPLGGCCGSK